MSHPPVIVFKDNIAVLPTLGDAPEVVGRDKIIWLKPPMIQAVPTERKLSPQKGQFTKEIEYETYLLKQESRSDGNVSSEYALVLELELPYLVKHLYAFPIVGRIGQAEDFRIEPEFQKHFTVKTVKDQEVAALEALHPNTMLSILEKSPDAIFEYWRNKIRIAIPISWSFDGITQRNGVYKLDITQEEYLAKRNNLFEVAADIVRAADTIKEEDQNLDNYVEISYARETRIVIAVFMVLTAVIVAGVVGGVSFVSGL